MLLLVVVFLSPGSGHGAPVMQGRCGEQKLIVNKPRGPASALPTLLGAGPIRPTRPPPRAPSLNRKRAGGRGGGKANVNVGQPPNDHDEAAANPVYLASCSSLPVVERDGKMESPEAAAVCAGRPVSPEWANMMLAGVVDK